MGTDLELDPVSPRRGLCGSCHAPIERLRREGKSILVEPFSIQGRLLLEATTITFTITAQRHRCRRKGKSA